MMNGLDHNDSGSVIQGENIPVGEEVFIGNNVKPMEVEEVITSEGCDIKIHDSDQEAADEAVISAVVADLLPDYDKIVTEEGPILDGNHPQKQNENVKAQDERPKENTDDIVTGEDVDLEEEEHKTEEEAEKIDCQKEDDKEEGVGEDSAFMVVVEEEDEKGGGQEENCSKNNDDPIIDTEVKENGGEEGEFNEEEYIVEKILDKKIDNDGFAKYLVKWEGYPNSQNTWEPLQNLVDCDKAMQKFEIQQAKKLANKQSNKKSKPDNDNGDGNDINDEKIKNIVNKIYEVEDVLGITTFDDDKYFLVSLKNSSPGFIRTSLANQMFPNKVIDFYLNHFKWKQNVNSSD